MSSCSFGRVARRIDARGQATTESPPVAAAASLATGYRRVEMSRRAWPGRFWGMPFVMNDMSQPPSYRAGAPGEDDESAREKLHRELDELLSELRVVIPGVTVLFAFLLTVPFSSRFKEIESGQQDAFFWLFITTFAALVLLVAPGVSHRIRFRANERHLLLPVWNVLAIVGLAVMFLAYVLAIYLVTSVVFSPDRATMISIGVGIPVALLWFAFPFFAGRNQSKP